MSIFSRILAKLGFGDSCHDNTNPAVRASPYPHCCARNARTHQRVSRAYSNK